MADYVRTQQQGVPAAMQTRYRDMGDGTHAEVVYATTGPDPGLTMIAGTTNVSGNTTLVGALAGTRYKLARVTLQNESATATTMQLLLGGVTVERVLGQNQGDGISVVYAEDTRPKGGANQALILNLSGANQCGYTIHYIKETV